MLRLPPPRSFDDCTIAAIIIVGVSEVARLARLGLGGAALQEGSRAGSGARPLLDCLSPKSYTLYVARWAFSRIRLLVAVTHRAGYRLGAVLSGGFSQGDARDAAAAPW
jgi:hypothetical protein